MKNNPLSIIQVEKKLEGESSQFKKQKGWRQEIQAKMERLWNQNPEQFNPERDCIERQRIEETIGTLKKKIDLKGKFVVDLGCGAGVISLIVRDEGASVDAVDIAGNALNRLKMHEMKGINPIQDCLPSTSLGDDTYDVVICTNVIGYLPQETYRLFFSELSRIVKPEGIVLCSTDLDFNTEEPLGRFNAIAETEFAIETWVFSYHHLFMILCCFFETPAYFIDIGKKKEIRSLEISKKKTVVGKWLLKLNTSFVVSFFWRLVDVAASPTGKWLRQNKWIMNQLEKVSRFIWNQEGISHALFIGKRRPLSFPLPQNEIPEEIKHKKEVWE